jgi:hypothetical protein
MKTGWSYDADARVFTSATGEKFEIAGELPKGTKVVHKAPRVARADPSKLSAAERDLRRYLQVILPPDHSPKDYLPRVRRWPSVECADLGPDISLPK